MTAATGLPAQTPSAESAAVYMHAVRRGGISVGDRTLCADLGVAPEVIESSLAELTELHLLREEYSSGHWRLVPVSPEVAAASLVSPIGEEIRRLHAEISQIQGRLTLFQPHYEASRHFASAAGGIESLRSEIELSGQLYLAAERCREAFAGFRPEGLLALESVAAMSGRGVSVRLLLQHSSRSDLRARPALRDIIKNGGEIRTVGQTPRQVIIFDDEVAFLIDDRDSSPNGVLIRHAETVQLLRDVIDMTWIAAEPYSADEIGYREVADDLQRTVIELLAAGLTDEAIARRLGLSVRTCRRHIAAVLSRLDAVSRFQAGALAATNNLVDAGRLRAAVPG